MAKDQPPSFQWYPRDFAASVAGMPPIAELAYRRALDASWLSQSYGVGSESDWTVWSQSSHVEWPSIRPWILRHVEVQPDGTWAQVRMAHERMEQELYARKMRGRPQNGPKVSSPSNESGSTVRILPPQSASAVGSESESKDGAAPRSILTAVKSVSQSLAVPNPAPRQDGPDTDMIKARIERFGSEKVREVCQIAWKLCNAGFRSPAMLERLITIYEARRGSIIQPFAYFNPGADGFKLLYEAEAGKMAEANGNAYKRAEVEALKAAK